MRAWQIRKSAATTPSASCTQRSGRTRPSPTSGKKVAATHSSRLIHEDPGRNAANRARVGRPSLNKSDTRPTPMITAAIRNRIDSEVLGRLASSRNAITAKPDANPPQTKFIAPL